MLTDDERRQGAQLLFDAERQRKAIPQLSKTFPGIEIVDAPIAFRIFGPN
jgi:2-oxo-hept-3-ene-1,7-dioate hydratase